MGYKLLGMIVWRGGRWYVARKYPDAPRKLAIGGAAAAVTGAIVVIAVRSRSDA